jgi:hypothetical protein
MEQIIMDFLGPVAGIPMVLTAMLVWWQRRAVRKWHVVVFVVLAAIGLVGFFAVWIAAMGHRMPEWLVMPLLHATAWLTVGSAGGFTVAFWVLWFGRFDRRPSGN